jgi:hypothetical protein
MLWTQILGGNRVNTNPLLYLVENYLLVLFIGPYLPHFYDFSWLQSFISIVAVQGDLAYLKSLKEFDLILRSVLIIEVYYSLP